MKTVYRNIEFVASPIVANAWVCRTRSGCILGSAEWITASKEHHFCPRRETVFSSDCLFDISDFLRQLNTAAPGGKGKSE